MNRRTLLAAAGWTAAAVVAVLVGIAAIGVIGAGLTSAAGRPRTEEQVARELANLPPATPSTGVPSASQAVGDAPGRTLVTRGGTVVARCTAAGTATIEALSPAPGFAVHEQDDDEGEFRGSDDHDRVKFDAVCAAGRPELVIREDD